MFERFFRKEEVGPKALVEGFVEDPEIQKLVSECAGLWRKAFAYTHDGQLDKAEEYAEELKKMVEENRDKMRVYLQPYIALGSEGLKAYARGTENDRRQVASMLL